MKFNLFDKVAQFRHAGILDKELAASRQMRVVTALQELSQEGVTLELAWLVDLEDGMIIDARYRSFGPTLLVGLTEVACEWVILKSYAQAARTSATILEQQIKDPSPLPKTANRYLNLILDCFEQLALQCQDIPLPEEISTPFAPGEIPVVDGGYPGWTTLSSTQQLQLIEELVKQEVRPYIEMDGGGITVKSIVGNEVTIVYEGACTSCFASTGSTLSYIQELLQAKLFPELVVIPENQ